MANPGLTVEPLLGTRGEANVTAPSTAVADAAELAVVSEAQRLEAIFTVFDESSALHDLRRNGTTDIPELEVVVDLAIEWNRRTHGAFHPSLQPLVDVWDSAEAQNLLPDIQLLKTTVDALTSPGPGQVALSGLNLNGIAKGWIADRSLAIAFAEQSVTSAWLSLGGDLIHRGESPVLVGIENPNRPYDNVAPMATVEIANEALATSGGGRRWWTIEGARYPKVLDPRSGQPSDHIHSATVIAPSAAAADVLATACLVLSPDEALALTKSENADCFLVRSDGGVVASSARFKQA